MPPAEEEQVDPYLLSLKEKFNDAGLKEDSDPKCDPLLQPLADTLEKWFHEQYTTKQIMETIALCHRPSNCDTLKVVEINEEVKNTWNAKIIRRTSVWDIYVLLSPNLYNH